MNERLNLDQRKNTALTIYKTMHTMIQNETRYLNLLSDNNIELQYPINALSIATELIFSLCFYPEYDNTQQRRDIDCEYVIDAILNEYNEEEFYDEINRVLINQYTACVINCN